MTVEPMLGPTFRAGSWVAVRVQLENNGPAVDGALELAPSTGGGSYRIPVQLPSGARQEHFVYGDAGVLSARFDANLVSGDTVVATQRLTMQPKSTSALRIYVVAERADALVAPLRGGAATNSNVAPEIVAISPANLPHRVEPWASIDMLVWQDADSNLLQADQIEALRAWLGTGGTLAIVGGSTGATRLGGLPADLLPFQPTAVVDVAPEDLIELVGGRPLDATSIPAFAGNIERGTSMVKGNPTFAAIGPYGRGSVALIGFDPTTPWIATSPGAANLWQRLVPAGTHPLADVLSGNLDEGYLTSALSAIPSVTLPRIDQLIILLAAYVICIGPINYLVLRRRDRREWAWLTMPAITAVFAVIAYGFGVAGRGSSVVVNELAVVRGATGSNLGIAQVHVGVYSPSRATFNVSVGGHPLLSSTQTTQGFDNFGRDIQTEPLDVELGDTSVIRDYQVGFGTLRSFQAEAVATTPNIETDLRLDGALLTGTVRNASAEDAVDVTLVYASGIQAIGTLAPGETHEVSLTTTTTAGGRSLAERLVPDPDPTDQAAVRSRSARQALIQHLAGGWNEPFNQRPSDVFGTGPVILAWRSGSVLDVNVGTAAEQVGETLYVLSGRASVHGPVSFTGNLLRNTTLDTDAIDAGVADKTHRVSQGTLTEEFRAPGLESQFTPTELRFRFSTNTEPTPNGEPQDLLTLPEAEQPPSDSPMLADPRPDDDFPAMPRMQLYDVVDQRWVELEPPQRAVTYTVQNPVRYVDDEGAFRVRFVARDPGLNAEFTFGVRLDGTVE